MAGLREYDFDSENKAEGQQNKTTLASPDIKPITPSEEVMTLVTMAADGYTAARIANRTKIPIDQVHDLIIVWGEEIDELRKILFIDRVRDYDRLLTKCLWRLEIKLDDIETSIPVGDIARIINTLSDRRDKLLGNRTEGDGALNINASKVLVLADAAESFSDKYKQVHLKALEAADDDPDSDD
jgi:hypothetical protein